MADFIHLHLHTEYSILDGTCQTGELISYCAKEGIDTVCITDHGNMYGALQFAEKAAAKNIKYIIGCEFNMCGDINDRQMTNQTEYLVLLAKDKAGYKNLVKLNSIAFVDGYFFKPRMDYKTLEKYANGLICLTSSVEGGLCRRILSGDMKGAKSFASYLKGIFGEDLYIELTDHHTEKERIVLPHLLSLSKELGIEVVATNDVHYLKKDQSDLQDVLSCIGNKQTLDDLNRTKLETDEYYFKSDEEMKRLFSAIPGAIENTKVIADKVTEPAFDLDKKGYPVRDNSLIPGYTPPDGSTPEEYLTNLTMEGLKKRYKVVTDEQMERAKYELSVICKMGYAEYYLIVWDFINWSKNQGIPVGPGRGSGVGSLVAYAIRITDVDPLKYGLLFERFLNPDRVSMPDFDIDFCTDRREETVNYVRQKYHPENVCQIITFGTMAAKQSIKDVGRVMKVPYNETDKLTKIMNGKDSISDHLGWGIDAARDRMNGETDSDKKDELRKKYEELQAVKSQDFINLYENDPSLHRVIDMALRVEGLPRQTGMHAAGVVICKKPISDNVPLSRNGEDITTQFVAKELEALGMLKMDFLGLVTLTDIKKCTDYIYEGYGIKVDFDEIGYNDPAPYALIGSGDTDGVFQLEAGGMKTFMRQLKPDGLEDLIAGVAIYRPGPMQNMNRFCNRKHGLEPISYECPQEEEILKVTYGIPVYQEQVMQIFQLLAGFSLGEADLVRRAMGKKDKKTLMAQKEKFIHGGKSDINDTYIDGCVKRGIPEEVAANIFMGMETFASYAFNKSHAAAYATVAYQTAWLKKYYCKEFLCALINNRIDNQKEITKYVNSIKKSGYKVYPPDINKSVSYFIVTEDGVRFGLAGLKGAGIAVSDEIINEREKGGPFTDFVDFVQRCQAFINKRVLESFIYGGVFDCFKVKRSQLIQVYEDVQQKAVKIAKEKDNPQMSLFGDILCDDKIEIKYPDIPEFDQGEKLSYEKDILGSYLSGHPFEKYSYLINECSFNTSMIGDVYVPMDTDDKVDGSEEYDEYQDVSNISKFKDGTKVTMAGMISRVRPTKSKKGNDLCIFDLDDIYGSIECMAFTMCYLKYRHLIVQDKIVRISGKISVKDDIVNINVDDVYEGEALIRRSAPTAEKVKKQPTLWLNAEHLSEEELADVKEIIKSYPGKDNRCIIVDKGERIVSPTGVNYCKALLAELGIYLNDDCIKFIGEN